MGKRMMAFLSLILAASISSQTASAETIIPNPISKQPVNMPPALEGNGSVRVTSDRVIVLSGIPQFDQVTVTLNYSVEGPSAISASIPEGSIVTVPNGGFVKDNQISWHLSSKGEGQISYTLSFAEQNSKASGLAQSVQIRSRVQSDASEWIKSDEAILTVLHPAAQYEDRPAYVFGYPDGTFRPDNPLTRAQGVSLLVRMLFPDGAYKNEDVKQMFTDVRVDSKHPQQSHWAAKEIAKGAKEGLISGDGDGAFRPEQPMSRGEYLLMLARALNKHPLKPIQIPYPDVKDESLQAAVGVLQQLGALNGFADGTLRPNLSLTRKEVVTVTNKVFLRFPLDRSTKASFTDVQPNEWYFGEVEAASTSNKFLRLPSSGNPLAGVGKEIK